MSTWHSGPVWTGYTGNVNMALESDRGGYTGNVNMALGSDRGGYTVAAPCNIILLTSVYISE